MDEKNPYIPEPVKILRITKETEDTSTFRIKKPSDFDPGRFVEISLLGFGEAPISICSCAKEHMDLCVRKVGRVTEKLLTMKEGDTIGVRGPYGKGYPMKDFMYKNILIIGGGTGVAPLKGVIEYLLANHKDFKDMSGFFGFRTPDDMLFKKQIPKWKERLNLEITVDKPDEKWKGPVGVITRLLEAASLKKDNTIVITCGPPIMIRFVIETLKKAGFEDSQIYVSLERLMKCGIGKCGHCLVQSKYVCKDGPVFCYEQARYMVD